MGGPEVSVLLTTATAHCWELCRRGTGWVLVPRRGAAASELAKPLILLRDE